MPPEPHTRESLFTEVWAEPTSKVAPRYGLSDRGLAKICEARNIPTPPRGYWAKLAHGHKVEQPPLPPAAPGDDGRIYFSSDPKAPTATPSDLPPEIAFEHRPENHIVVPERLGKVHPLVEKTRTRLKAERPAQWTRGLVSTREGLDVNVAPGSIPRALRIMQALVQALERRGHEVSAARKHRGGIVASMQGEQVPFRLIERTKQILTGKDYPRYDLAPTGVLALEIVDCYPAAAITDRTKKKLEERLNEFVVKMLEVAFAMRKRREERQREEVASRERQRLWEIAEEKRREEEKKIAQLDENTCSGCRRT